MNDQNNQTQNSGEDRIYNIHEKLGLIQTGLKVPKGQYNSFGNFNYRSAEDIFSAVKPLLYQFGCVLSVKDDIVAFGDRLFIKATVSFYSANEPENVIETQAFAEICQHANMSLDQCTGSASSYARKYAMNGLFLLDDVKDSDTDEMKRIENGKQAPATSTASSTSQKKNWGNHTQPAQSAQSAPAAPQKSWGNRTQSAPQAGQQAPSQAPRRNWGNR